ncbi:MAG: hypothetical protein E7317_05480 [Clostridiales bacterium]|nr:hypothetical protein [Clostridiales bacterium]
MRSFIALLLALTLMLTALPLTALAEEATSSEGETETVPAESGEEEEIPETGMLVLPPNATEIGEEAFRGCSFTSFTVPETVTSIGDYAFADCPNLLIAGIPASVTQIGEGILSGVSGGFFLYTGAGSAAMEYALNNDIDFTADTVYRALLIGNRYEDPDDGLENLTGPTNDIEGMTTCLESFGVTHYQVTPLLDVSGQGILDAIQDTFGDAGPQDVSLFYYSGHGALDEDGAALIGDDLENVYASQLRAALDRIPGRKIVLVDCCYSGGLLWRTARSLKSAAAAQTSSSEDVDEFTSMFMMPFTRKSRSANTLAADRYFVLTACAYDEESYEGTVSGVRRGIFTYRVMQAWGYNGKKFIAKKADANGNDVVTFEETSDWVTSQMESEWQSVQHWPDGCDWFGVVRD